MRTLAPAERRAFRAKAHHLHPLVTVGQQGLTPAVVHEIDVNLLAHELIKIRVFVDDRREREALLQRICEQLDAAPVQHLGKVLTIWRPAPEPEKAPAKPREPLKSPARQAHRRPPPNRGAQPEGAGADDLPRRRVSSRSKAKPPAAEPDGARRRSAPFPGRAPPREASQAAARRRRGTSAGSDKAGPRFRGATPRGQTAPDASSSGKPRRRKPVPRDAVAAVQPRPRRRKTR